MHSFRDGHIYVFSDDQTTLAQQHFAEPTSTSWLNVEAVAAEYAKATADVEPIFKVYDAMVIGARYAQAFEQSDPDQWGFYPLVTPDMDEYECDDVSMQQAGKILRALYVGRLVRELPLYIDHYRELRKLDRDIAVLGQAGSPNYAEHLRNNTRSRALVDAAFTDMIDETREYAHVTLDIPAMLAMINTLVTPNPYPEDTLDEQEFLRTTLAKINTPQASAPGTPQPASGGNDPAP